MLTTNNSRQADWSRGPTCGLLLLLIGAGTTAFAENVIPDNVTVQTGDSPRVRLEQTAGMQQPRNWDIVGTESSFRVRDDTADTYPFSIGASAPTNSIYIATSGLVGFGTANPLVQLHVSTSVIPTLRLESSARTWDVSTNVAGFNVVDVTNANAIPFGIQAGAPTGTVYLNNNGNVGIGTLTADANSKVDIRSTLKTNGMLMKRADAGPHFLRIEDSSGSVFRCGVQGNGDTQFGALTAGRGLALVAGGTGKLSINASGQVSFGSTPPAITTHALVHASGARLTAGGIWTDASSRTFKQDIEPITSEEARDTVRALQPVGYRYKNELDERYVGFIAEDVPELVATRDRKALAPMDIVGVLTKVVQDQDQQLVEQKRINAELSDRLLKLEQLLGRGTAKDGNRLK